MTNSAINRYRLIESQLKQANADKKKSEEDFKHHTARIAMLEPWLKELGECICKKCNGHGELWNHVSQSEAYLIKCDKCDGTGTTELKAAA